MPNEEWVSVRDWPNYEVSTLGRIRRVNSGRCAGQICVARPNHAGYLRVALSRDGLSRSVRVHRIVAAAFLDPDPNRSEVNHIDGDKTNNRPDNLEWATRRENMGHAYRTGLIRRPRGEDHARAKLTVETVKRIKSLLASGMKNAQVAREVGITRFHVGHIKAGACWGWVEVDA